MSAEYELEPELEPELESKLEPSVGFIVRHGVLLCATQVLASHLLPVGVDIILATIPFGAIAAIHGSLYAPRISVPVHTAIMFVGTLTVTVLEAFTFLQQNNYDTTGLVEVSLDVFLLIGFVNWVGLTSMRILHYRFPS